MVPALMALEEDRTLKSRKSPVSLKNCRSPFSFLCFPWQARQQTTQPLNKRNAFVLCAVNFALPQPLTGCSSVDSGWPRVTRTERNGRIYAHVNLSFITLGDHRTAERGPFISINHALMYFNSISLSIHPTILFWKTLLQNMYLWRSLPFMVLANTADTNDLKKNEIKAVKMLSFSWK